METFRCPTCIVILTDAGVARCPACGQRLRRRQPRVLGEERRLEAKQLPVDRWMLERLHGGQPRTGRPRPIAPLAWHGRFSATPPAELEPVAVTTAVIVAHDALDPEVRTLVDDLYDRARAEVSGTSVHETPADGWVAAYVAEEPPPADPSDDAGGRLR